MNFFDRIGLRAKTFRHFAGLTKRGHYFELVMIGRRRTVNLFKFGRRVVTRVFGIYYHHPSIKKPRQKRQLKRLLKKYYDFSAEDSSDAIKVALIAKNADTYPFSSFFIRLLSPLTDPNLKGKVSLYLLPEDTTSVPDGTQVCIVQRTALSRLSTARQLVANLKGAKCALAVGSDDAFHIIDKNHPEHATHKNSLAAFDHLLAHADQVWLSTEELVESLSSYSRRKPRVIKNSLDPRLWQNLLRPPKHVKGPLRFVYMGTVSHQADLELIMPALKSLAQKYPGSFSLRVMGITPDPIEYPWAKRIYQKRNGSIYPKFVKWFQRQGPFDLGLAPLINTEFNRNKSDIKALDYLAAGIVPMVSDVQAYRTKELAPMIIRVNNSVEAWQQALESVIKNKEVFRSERMRKIKMAQKYILRERSSSVTAAKLYSYLQALAKRR